MLDQEHHDLTRALYRTYLVYRERFLRGRGLMDTIDVDADPLVRREWRRARTDARKLQRHLSRRWASAIIAEQRRAGAHPGTEATANQHDPHATARDLSGHDLRQVATAVGVEHLRSARGDIPQALYNLEQQLRRRLLEDEHEAAIAVIAAHELTRYVNDRWAATVQQFAI